MNDPQFQYIATLEPRWGRPLTMCQWRGDILIAMEYGQIVRVSENQYTAQIYVQEINFAHAAPMPSPI